MTISRDITMRSVRSMHEACNGGVEQISALPCLRLRPTAATVVTIARPQLAWAGRWDTHRSIRVLSRLWAPISGTTPHMDPHRP
jgi:hypothetical protein